MEQVSKYEYIRLLVALKMILKDIEALNIANKVHSYEIAVKTINTIK